jgi:hypothetical protein
MELEQRPPVVVQRKRRRKKAKQPHGRGKRRFHNAMLKDFADDTDVPRFSEEYLNKELENKPLPVKRLNNATIPMLLLQREIGLWNCACQKERFQSKMTVRSQENAESPDTPLQKR